LERLPKLATSSSITRRAVPLRVRPQYVVMAFYRSDVPIGPHNDFLGLGAIMV
jgi:hypothetical protein